MSTEELQAAVVAAKTAFNAALDRLDAGNSDRAAFAAWKAASAALYAAKAALAAVVPEEPAPRDPKFRWNGKDEDGDWAD